MAGVVILAAAYLAGSSAHQAEPDGAIYVPPPPIVRLDRPSDPRLNPIVQPPRAISVPDTAIIRAAYPKLALLLNVPGQAKVRCYVDLFGKTNGCSIAQETPSGFGFGKAAMEIAGYFKLTPKLVDGAAVDHGLVTIPIKFSLEPRDPAPGPLTYSQAVVCYALHRARLNLSPEYGDSMRQSEVAAELARSRGQAERKNPSAIDGELDRLKDGGEAALALLRSDEHPMFWQPPAKLKCDAMS
jgi:TonB family protein